MFGVVTLLAVLVWLVADATSALVLYCLCLLGLLYRHKLHLDTLIAWLRDSARPEVPDGQGVWGEAYSLLARLLRQQRRSETALTATVTRFQQAGAAMPDGLLILGEDDRIEWCNPSAEDHLGVNAAQDIGQQVTYLVRAPQFLEYLASESHADPLQLRLVRDFGRPRLLSVQLIPFGDKQKLVLTRDITRLEAVETMRQDFVANVSHELRTPLTVVVGFLEMIMDMKGIPQPAVRPLQLAMEQALRMQRLVEDLLTLSRLESAGSPVREDAVDVPALVRALQQEALTLSGGRHRITLALDCEAGVLGSLEELRSGFLNLVTNAIRYTPAGGSITLAWQCTERQARFVVEDTGIGIDPQHIPRLTERFYRVDRSRSRETGGTGLGLAIVKHVLTRHRGWLEVSSEPGKGSRFSAVFPEHRLVAAPGANHAPSDQAA